MAPPDFPSSETGPLTPGKPFGARYHVIRLLGIGGMGAVYQAWDQELGVAVAVKVIRPEAISDPADALEMERRFKRELLLARQVTHRNVVRIHDLGEIDGIKYITMPYVDGEDLSTRLRRKTKLPVPMALGIAREIVSGLVAAHEAGVVHRDLKPANIMLDKEDHALIMDFGIARSSGPAAVTIAPPPPAPRPLVVRTPAPVFSSDDATQAVTQSGSQGATQGATVVARAPVSAAGDDITMVSHDSETIGVAGATSEPPTPRLTPGGLAAPSIAQGAIVGTLEFMAPEQARGQDVDERADMYAFGLIFLEMLLGRRRKAAGVNPFDALNARIETPPVSLRETDPTIPEAVDALVLRCLQLNRDDRFPTTADLAAALDRLDADGNVIPEPVIRRFTPRTIAAGVAVMSVLLAGTWWFARGRPAPVQPPPLSVLISDFTNATKDPALDGSVEQSLAIALEGASFITTFPRSTALRLAAQLRSTHGVDEATAQLIAVSEGVNVVLAGAIEPRGNGYRINVRALDSEGKQLQALSANAAAKTDVLPAVSQLASTLRDRFGDTTSRKSRQADVETFTAASLDAVREYVQAQDLASAGKDDQAIGHYQAALAKDETFGRAYSGWAVSAFKLGRRAEADEAYKKAFAVADRMTEREKYRTYGAYFLQFAGNYEKAIENYKELVKRWPSDGGGHSNLALAYFTVLDFADAQAEGLKAVEIYPRNLTFRSNYALYKMYASDFTNASAEAQKVIEADPTFRKGYLPIAVGAIDAGDLNLARSTYERMSQAGVLGASLAAAGLGDLAIYSGNYRDAEAPLTAGIAADLLAKRTTGAVAKYMALAEALMAQGRTAEARKAAADGAAWLDAVPAQVPRARLLIRMGADADAQKIADDLGSKLQPDKRAYAKIIEAEIAMAHRRSAQAVEALAAAQKLTDHWLGRFDLGVAYVEADAFAEAVSELELADKRRGEATALFLDDWPTTRYLAPLQYWLGRAHEGLGTLPAARANYAAFLKIRPVTLRDPLAIDAQKRLTALGK